MLRLVLAAACLVADAAASDASAADDPYPWIAAAYVVKRDGAVLWAGQPDARLAPASLAKMMTALIALERGGLEQPVTLGHGVLQATGTRIGLKPGDKLTAGKTTFTIYVEGSPTTECSSPNFTDEATTWGNIVQNTSSDVDAIISGHTHLAYNHLFEGRPVVSAGQYGTNLNKLVFSVDPVADTVALVSQDVVLFDTSVAENIAMGKLGASQAEIEAAVDRSDGYPQYLRMLGGICLRLGYQAMLAKLVG